LLAVLLAASIANAAVVPYEVLDARAPATQQLPSTEDIQAALEVVANETPGNVFDDIEQGFRSRTGLDVLRDFFGRLFGWDNEDVPNAPVTVTVSVTPSAEVTSESPSAEVTSESPSAEVTSESPSAEVTSESPSAEVTSESPSAEVTSESVAVSSDLPATTTEDVVVIPEITAEPSDDGIMSILPIGDVSSMINATIPEPEFTDLPVPNESIPPAVVITESFTAVVPSISIITDVLDGEITVSEDVTSIILVTATIDGTGIAEGTGGPILNTEVPTWANTTTTVTESVETEIPVEVVDATGEPIATIDASVTVELPPFANSTEVASVEVPVIGPTEIPTIEEPAATEEPVVEEPAATEEPAVDEPAVDEPVVTESDLPLIDVLPTDLPTIDVFLTDLPTIDPLPDFPIINVLPTEAPTVSVPIADEDTVGPTVEVPVVDDTADVPVVDVPAVDAPAVDDTDAATILLPTVDAPEVAASDLPLILGLPTPDVDADVEAGLNILPLQNFPGQF
jgi:hypothetical protein